MCVGHFVAACKHVLQHFKALRFLIARDLETSDGYQAFANKSISWATFHAFAALFIYGFHARRKVPTVRAFATLYSIFTLAAAYASSEWHKLYWYALVSLARARVLQHEYLIARICSLAAI